MSENVTYRCSICGKVFNEQGEQTCECPDDEIVEVEEEDRYDDTVYVLLNDGHLKPIPHDEFLRICKAHKTHAVKITDYQ